MNKYKELFSPSGEVSSFTTVDYTTPGFDKEKLIPIQPGDRSVELGEVAITGIINSTPENDIAE